jgi:hypothetical protein
LLTEYEDHNLWILDERLTFTSYVASDLPLDGRQDRTPDLLIFDKRVAFRVENETSNPVIVFEFKRPNRRRLRQPSVEGGSRSPNHPLREQAFVRVVTARRSGER